jgi:hypothetical protein
MGHLVVERRVEHLMLDEVVVAVGAGRAAMMVADAVLAVSGRLEAVARRVDVGRRLGGLPFPAGLAQAEAAAHASASKLETKLRFLKIFSPKNIVAKCFRPKILLLF